MLQSQHSKFNESQFNPYFFPAAKSVIGARSEAGQSVTSAKRRMSKEVQDRLYGKVPHMCTRLCSVYHFGPRLRPATGCKNITHSCLLNRDRRHDEEGRVGLEGAARQRGQVVESIEVYEWVKDVRIYD